MRMPPELSGDGQRASSSTIGGGGFTRFPLAAQPEIMRAAEKDEQYASFVYDACRDAFRHIFGTRVAVNYQNETKLLGQMLYYILTTGAGQQTLGEEYCDIIQVTGPYGLSPTPAKRALFIFYQTTVPYLAERASSRMASQGITATLADSLDEDLGGTATGGLQVQLPESPGSVVNPRSVLSSLKAKIVGLWSYLVQRWSSMLPLAREVLQMVLRANLMFFYFEGLYYHVSKRTSGIRYVFIGKPTSQRQSFHGADIKY